MSLALIDTATGELAPAGPRRAAAAELAGESRELLELLGAVLVHGTHYGTIPGTPRPCLYKPGAEWLLKWARLGHRLTAVEVERDAAGKKEAVTYRAEVFSLDAPDVTVATCDGYAGYDEGNRSSKWGWNTVIKMAQKRALVGAALQATGASGLFTQDVEDVHSEPPLWLSLGWASDEALRAAHDPFVADLKAAPEEVRAAVKALRESLGFDRLPVSPAVLDELKARLVERQEAPSAPDTPQEAPEAASGDAGPASGDPDDEAADGVAVCIGCGGPLEPTDPAPYHPGCEPF